MQDIKKELERKDFIKMTAKPAFATSAAVAFVLKTDAVLAGLTIPIDSHYYAGAQPTGGR